MLQVHQKQRAEAFSANGGYLTLHGQLNCPGIHINPQVDMLVVSRLDCYSASDFTISLKNIFSSLEHSGASQRLRCLAVWSGGFAIWTDVCAFLASNIYRFKALELLIPFRQYTGCAKGLSGEIQFRTITSQMARAAGNMCFERVAELTGVRLPHIEYAECVPKSQIAHLRKEAP